MFMQKSAVAVSCSAFILSPAALAGPEWVEQGDAGGKIETAQRTAGVGDLNSIVGNLFGVSAFNLGGGGDFEDMYLVTVVNPGIFQLTVDASFDAQLFLFNVTIPGEAFGLLANDNTLLGTNPELTPMANDGTGAALLLPGVYAIAISGAGRIPVSLNGAIFNFASSTEISGPDGPGGLNPHLDWSGEGEIGGYKIDLVGVSFVDLPEPGAMALLALAAGIARRRRDR